MNKFTVPLNCCIPGRCYQKFHCNVNRDDVGCAMEVTLHYSQNAFANLKYRQNPGIYKKMQDMETQSDVQLSWNEGSRKMNQGPRCK